MFCLFTVEDLIGEVIQYIQVVESTTRYFLEGANPPQLNILHFGDIFLQLIFFKLHSLNMQNNHWIISEWLL